MRSTCALAVTLWAVCAPALADPGLAVTIANGRPGAFSVHASAATQLRTVAAIEAKRDGAWIDVSAGLDVGDGYRLLAQCDAKPAACVTLAAGATLAPVPWSGMSCSSQCNRTCDKNVPLPAGDYRLVVTSCDGTRTVTGPAFRLDGKPR